MTAVSPSPSPRRNTVKRVAAVTAALPVVVLSSMALAQPATAAGHPQPAKPTAGNLPANLTGIRTGVRPATTAFMPASALASAVPSRLAPAAPASMPSEYTIQPGDTVTAIAAKFGLRVNDVLAANNLSNNSLIFPGKTLKLQGGNSTASAAPATTPAAPASSSDTNYTIKPGDTVSGIAAQFGLRVSDVLAANNLSNNSLIFPGKTLKLRGGVSEPTLAASVVVAASPAPATPAPAPAAMGGSYTIASGDTLTSIAAAHHVGIAELMSANQLSRTSIIYAGKKLTIPGADAGASSAPATPAAPTATPTAQVSNTFLDYTYPDAVVAQANVNKVALMAAPVPSQAQMKQIVASTAQQMGVDPALAMAFALQESGFNQQAVSPANAIGTMQVIPSSGEWASELVGRHLNLLNPYDNVTAGVAIIRALVATSPSTEEAIAGYYQGQTSVARHGMYDDTKAYVAAIMANRQLF